MWLKYRMERHPSTTTVTTNSDTTNTNGPDEWALFYLRICQHLLSNAVGNDSPTRQNNVQREELLRLLDRSTNSPNENNNNTTTLNNNQQLLPSSTIILGHLYNVRAGQDSSVSINNQYDHTISSLSIQHHINAIEYKQRETIVVEHYHNGKYKEVVEMLVDILNESSNISDNSNNNNSTTTAAITNPSAKMTTSVANRMKLLEILEQSSLTLGTKISFLFIFTILSPFQVN